MRIDKEKVAFVLAECDLGDRVNEVSKQIARTNAEYEKLEEMTDKLNETLDIINRGIEKYQTKIDLNDEEKQFLLKCIKYAMPMLNIFGKDKALADKLKEKLSIGAGNE